MTETTKGGQQHQHYELACALKHCVALIEHKTAVLALTTTEKETRAMGRGSNFGLGSRDMGKAADFAMKAEARDGNASFSTAETVSERFQQFAEFAKGEGMRRLEEVSRETVTAYGQALADRVENQELSASYAQNLVSAVNTVLNTASRGQWESVSPTKECNIAERSNVRETPAGSADRATYEQARKGLSERGQAIADMARELGMRSKEASLIDTHKACEQARKTGSVTISDGTKGGRPRELDNLSERQISALERASEVQGADRSMVPADQTWAQFRDGELREAREALQMQNIEGLHDLRAGYAADRYQELTGQRPSVEGGRASREADLAARKQIAAELGHGRIDITNSYLGGR